MNKIIILIILLAFINTIKAETLKIATWNIAWLSSYKYNKRTAADYAELARYAKQLDADIIALQEVEGENWAKKVFGDDYNYYFSTKDWFQRVGYAIKKSLDYKFNGAEYRELNVGRVRYGMDLLLTKDDKKLRLLAVHLKSGCFDNKLDSKSLRSMKEHSKEKFKTKQDCNVLNKQIEPLESWIDARAKEGVPFIVLGDFNRRFSIEVDKKYNEKQGLWQAIDDEGVEDMWAPSITKNSACWGGYYKHYIDHIVLDPLAKALYVENSFNQLVFDQEYSKKLSQNLSDHCPISIEIEFK